MLAWHFSNWRRYFIVGFLLEWCQPTAALSENIVYSRHTSKTALMMTPLITHIMSTAAASANYSNCPIVEPVATPSVISVNPGLWWQLKGKWEFKPTARGAAGRLQSSSNLSCGATAPPSSLTSSSCPASASIRAHNDEEEHRANYYWGRENHLFHLGCYQQSGWTKS